MKKINLFAVAFVAVFTQSVIANAAKTNRGYFYFDAKKSEAKSVFAMGTDVAAMGIAKDGLFVYASEAKAERGKCRSAYPAIMGTDVAAMGIAKDGLFVYASEAKAERGGKCRSAYPAIMGTDVAAMGIAKDGLFVYASETKAERGKCRSAYPAIMGTDVAAMGIAKEAYPPMQRGAMRGVEYPQTERGKC